MVNVSKITNEKVNIFFNVIGKLKQQVILKWNPDVDVTIPQNVITSSWFPQADILGKVYIIIKIIMKYCDHYTL